MEEIKRYMDENPEVYPTAKQVVENTNKDDERQHKWFDSGVRAKKRGYGNFSPFYENATADYFFKCGFDGATFEQSQEALTENIKNFLEKDSTVLEAIKELQTETNNAG